MGKGAAIRTGISEASGDFVAIQDADLEYDPQDLLRLVGPLIAGKADVVIGSRFLSSGAHRVLYFWHSAGNKFLTLLSNMLTDLNLTDMECCYKGRLEKFLSPSPDEPDSMSARGHERMERASDGAEGLFRC
jgi:dolichol-phosphate mannosyltransferase